MFSEKKIDNRDFIAVIIIVAGAILRFYNYAGWSLSNDELSAMSRLRFSGFSEMLEKGVMLNDMHPLGVQSFLWCWTHLFGTSEYVFRLPFVILGCAAVWIFYLIACKWFNKTTALFAVSLFAFLQFPILYSQLARPYSPGLFFSLLFVYTWTRILFDEVKTSFQKKYLFLLFVLAGVACMYSHYFSFMFVGIVGLTGIFFLKKENRTAYFLSGIIMFVLYIPNLKIFLYQFGIGGLGGDGGWLGPPKHDAVFQYIYYGLNESSSILIVCAAILIGSIVLNKEKVQFRKFQKLSLLFFFLPALIAYFYSIFKNPVFQYSILLFSFPFLLLFIFSFISDREWNNRQLFTVTALSLLVIYSTVIEKKYYSTQHFAVFKELAEKTVQYSKKYGENNIVNTVNVITPFYIDYYMSREKEKVVYDKYAAITPAQIKDLLKLASGSKEKYFLHAWSNTYHAPEVEQIISQFYPYVIERDSFFNSGIKVFSKEKTTRENYNRKIIFQEENNFEKAKWENDSLFIFPTVAHSGHSVAIMKPDNEYGPGYITTAREINLRKNTTVEISIWVNSQDTILNDISVVFSVEHNESSLIWRGTHFSDFVNESGVWRQIFLAYDVREDISPNDKVSIYIWNAAHKKFLIDDFSIKILQ